MEISISVRFCYGHRLMRHKGKCKNVHGHNAVAVIKYNGDLNDLNMVADFGDGKKEIKKWIDAEWDHAFLYNSHDIDMASALRGLASKKYEIPGEPTAEGMAKELFSVASRFVPDGVLVTSASVQETETTMATCTE